MRFVDVIGRCGLLARLVGKGGRSRLDGDCLSSYE
jgi:hypothetical protein